MLPADEGDALWIEYDGDDGRVHRVLVDCGRKTAYRAVRARLATAERAGESLDFDLFVLTHVDADHIEGAVPLLGDRLFPPDRVRDVWFNGWRHLQGERVPPDDRLGARQGEYFAALIRDRGFAWNAAFDHRPVAVEEQGPLPTATLAGGMRLTLLSPTWPRLEAMREAWARQLRDRPVGHPDHIEPGDWRKALEVLDRKPALQPDALGSDWVASWDPARFDRYAAAPYAEDAKEPNGSSIALLAEHGGLSVLLAADAFPSVLEQSLARLRTERRLAAPLPVNAVKLSHHGSQGNTSPEMVRAVRCRHWLVSTNGTRHQHPHPEAIARVIEGARGRRPVLHFNYRCDESKVWDDDDLRVERDYSTVYGPREGGLRVELES